MKKDKANINTLYSHKAAGYATLFSVLILLALSSAIVLSHFSEVRKQLKHSQQYYYHAQTQEAAEAGIDYALFKINEDQGINTSPLAAPATYLGGNATFSVTLALVDPTKQIIEAISEGTFTGQPDIKSRIRVYFAPADKTATPLVFAKIPGTWTNSPPSGP